MRISPLLVAFAVVASPAHAGDESRDGERSKHRTPPTVALDACSTSVEGDPCSFEGRHGDSLDGSCVQFEETTLACKPDNPPQRRLERAPEADDA